jgi:hypothetical protein
MGTDIHSIIQYRANDKGTWRTDSARLCDDRNYDTFAILADVRNGTGFAGCETGETWPVIAPARGLPKDMFDGDYPQMKDKSHTDCPHCYGEGTMWLGDHTHSWVTLAEMKSMAEALRSRGQYVESGIVSLDQYEAFLSGIMPTSWSGGISGANIKQVDLRNLNADERNPNALRKLGITHVRLQWSRPVEKCASSFFKYIAEMEKVKVEQDYGDHHRPTDDDIRLVFGFDS